MSKKKLIKTVTSAERKCIFKKCSNFCGENSSFCKECIQGMVKPYDRILCDVCGDEMVFVDITYMETQLYVCKNCGREAEEPWAGTTHYFGETKNHGVNKTKKFVEEKDE